MSAFPASGYILHGIFAVFALMAVTGAMIAALTTRVIRSVCGLALCCFGLAGLYYFLHSPLLALMEILIYVGAVCVTIVFAVMLAETDEPARTERGGAAAGWGMLAFVASCAAFWGILLLGLGADWPHPAARVSDGSVQAIGVSLLTTYSMAFELISLVLLVAILGALVIARSGRTKP